MPVKFIYTCITTISLLYIRPFPSQNIALLQRNCKSLEEELVEVKASAEEARAQESQGKTIR